MLLSSLVLYAGALTVAAATPGPGVATIVARVLGRGPAGAFGLVLGMALGDCTWLTASVVGLTVLAQTFHWLFVALRFAGGAYLLYMAWKLWTTPVQAAEIQAERASETPIRLFLTGFSVAMGNPKVMVFYLALLPAFVDMRHVDLLNWFTLLVTTAFVLIGVLSVYIFAAHAARGFFARARARKILNRVTGGVMAGAAVSIMAG